MLYSTLRVKYLYHLQSRLPSYTLNAPKIKERRPLPLRKPLLRAECRIAYTWIPSRPSRSRNEKLQLFSIHVTFDPTLRYARCVSIQEQHRTLPFNESSIRKQFHISHFLRRPLLEGFDCRCSHRCQGSGVYCRLAVPFPIGKRTKRFRRRVRGLCLLLSRLVRFWMLSRRRYD